MCWFFALSFFHVSSASQRPSANLKNKNKKKTFFLFLIINFLEKRSRTNRNRPTKRARETRDVTNVTRRNAVLFVWEPLFTRNISSRVLSSTQSQQSAVSKWSWGSKNKNKKCTPWPASFLLLRRRKNVWSIGTQGRSKNVSGSCMIYVCAVLSTSRPIIVGGFPRSIPRTTTEVYYYRIALLLLCFVNKDANYRMRKPLTRG